MDDPESHADPDQYQSQPTIEGTGPAGGGASPGDDAGGNKRDPISSSPTIGHTIAGRTLDGEGTTQEGGEPDQEELGGGVHLDDRPHTNRE